MTRIKFCGLTSADDARAALEAGASYLGVIFAGGPRNLTGDAAAAVLADCGQAERVGVFGDSDVRVIARIAEEVQLDVVQLHADPSPAFARAVRAATGRKIWVAIRVSNTLDENDLDNYISSADAVVFDTRSHGTLGGSGRSFDWSLVTNVLHPHRRQRATVVLAGGLNPMNVAAAIGTLRPDIVDVSSGIESAPGVKDHALMRTFASAVREAR